MSPIIDFGLTQDSEKIFSFQNSILGKQCPAAGALVDENFQLAIPKTSGLRTRSLGQLQLVITVVIIDK